MWISSHRDIVFYSSYSILFFFSLYLTRGSYDEIFREIHECINEAFLYFSSFPVDEYTMVIAVVVSQNKLILPAQGNLLTAR